MSLILVIVLFASQMSYYEAKDTTFGCTSIEEVSRLRSLRSDQMAFQIALLEKQILLRDEYGYVLAISLNHIRLDDLKMQLGLDVELADEYEIEELFDDCVRGAIPPAGECYGLDTVVDDSIKDQPEVYLEGGDHETLVHMSNACRNAYRDSTTRQLQRSRLTIAGVTCMGEFVKVASVSEIAPGGAGRGGR